MPKMFNTKDLFNYCFETTIILHCGSSWQIQRYEPKENACLLIADDQMAEYQWLISNQEVELSDLGKCLVKDADGDEIILKFERKVPQTPSFFGEAIDRDKYIQQHGLFAKKFSIPELMTGFLETFRVGDTDL